jgi:hypothetical protein
MFCTSRHVRLPLKHLHKQTKAEVITTSDLKTPFDNNTSWTALGDDMKYKFQYSLEKFIDLT